MLIETVTGKATAGRVLALMGPSGVHAMEVASLYSFKNAWLGLTRLFLAGHRGLITIPSRVPGM